MAGEAPSFVLAGDSHAYAISARVLPLPPGWTFRLSIYGELLSSTPGHKAGEARFDDLTVRFVEFLRERPSLRIVVVGYWEVQARGQSYRKKPRIYLDDDYDGSGLAYNKVSFQHGLQRLVDAFPDRRFIIVEDVPVGLKFRYAYRAMHIQNVLGRGLRVSRSS